MPVSPISTSNTLTLTATLTQLIEYLTAPLHASYPRSTVAAAKVILQTHFFSLITSGTVAPFSMILSSTFLPPAPILAACIASGGTLLWVDWLCSLSGGQNVFIFVMEGCLQARIGDEGDLSTIWSAPSDEPTQVLSISKTVVKKEQQGGGASSMTQKLNQLLDSVRARRAEPAPIRIPTLLSPSPSEDDSDSESDTDSTASFSFSATSSDAETLVSSPATPESGKLGLPVVVEGLDDDSKPIPAYRLPSSRTQLQRHAVLDRSKKEVTRYMYQGGQTGVITGGVMLGGGSCEAKTQMTKSRPFTPKKAAAAGGAPRRFSPRLTQRKTNVMLGPDNDDNWRRGSPRVSA
ncbi:hypothetical protein E1B28_003152 [Marasmius oreades]|uniref:Uncharacterized protein n=1 Tax=Marasmius oreades TaxID=181124 RepID=A0A9P7RKE7_9AGAR|nr:uncharacterized protein E1B28_003152 [Marasmius oreades]KAG7085601.1 hypothetical protein E1B28_003152 [Marasmius oreades]